MSLPQFLIKTIKSLKGNVENTAGKHYEEKEDDK